MLVAEESVYVVAFHCMSRVFVMPEASLNSRSSNRSEANGKEEALALRLLGDLGPLRVAVPLAVLELAAFSFTVLILFIVT
jgi:hypothetical protein